MSIGERIVRVENSRIVFAKKIIALLVVFSNIKRKEIVQLGWDLKFSKSERIKNLIFSMLS